jgi:hypothetical protein
MDDDNRPEAEEDLKYRLKTARMVAERGDHWERIANEITARNVLQEDLGRFKGHQPDYHLHQTVRDRLLAHTRQDAAHALINTVTLMDNAWKARKSWSGWAISAITVLILMGYVFVMKPTSCRAGFVPTFVLFDGWVCAPGYKP